jgi:hypothetical protein
MSTKTTFKRIALVAVAALGFGMLSAVPSNAASAASIVVGTVPAARPGQTVAVPITVFLPAGLTAGTDTITVNIEAISAPLQGGASNAQSVFNTLQSQTGNAVGQLVSLASAATATTPTGVPAITGSTGVAGRVVFSSGIIRSGATTTAGTGAAAATSGTMSLAAADISAGRISLFALVTPDVAGSYSFLVSTSAHTTAVAASSAYRAGDVNTSFTLTGGNNTVTAVTLTALAGSAILAGSTNGVPVQVSLTGGTLSGVEGINLTATGGGRIAPANGAVPGTFAAAGATTALTAASFNGGTTAIVWLRSAITTAETINLVATSAAMPTSLTASRTFEVTAQAGDATNVITLQAPTAGAATAPTFAANNVTGGTTGTSTYTVATTSTSQSIGFTTPALAASAARVGFVTVTDTLGLLTGVAGLVYDRSFSTTFGTAASGGSLAFTANMSNVPATTTAYTVAFQQGATGTAGTSAAQTITFQAAAPTSTGGSISVTPSTTILAAPGAALALTARVRDQFGSTILNAPMSVRTTGRNNPADTAANTGATGSYTFTTADASTSTTNLVDTVTFSSGSATAGSVTITYRDAAVGTVTVTGGNTTASVTALTNTDNPISVGSSTTGAEAGAISITATVRDALGNALAGVPVSFTTDAAAPDAFRSTTAVVYTSSTGTAVGSLYAWINGTYTYTVTAGGKTTTGTATFASNAAGNARVISATVAGNVVTGKAVDRFGNAVSNVPLWAVATGGANIGGAFIATGSTLADGTLSFVVTGAGSVTITAVNPALPTGTTAAQTCALAGNATCATASTAAVKYGATTVGTATTAETNVGATFAPAGVASATVTVADVSRATAIADKASTDAAIAALKAQLEAAAVKAAADKASSDAALAAAQVAAVDAATAAADAAAEATDAANAATDAANASAEAADAATAAAQDAADAIAALSAQVSEMIDTLKKQITALTNLVIKIQKKVKA